MNQSINKVVLPPVTKLITDSWLTLKESFVRLILLYLIGFGLILAIAAIFFIIALIFGIGSFIFNPSQMMQPQVFVPLIIVGGLLLVVAIAAFIIVGSTLQIATIRVIADSTVKKSSWQTFRESFPLIWPLFAAGFLTSILALGGIFLLIIPGIVISLLLSFTSFEVVLNNQRGLEALKRSYLIFSRNFWGIFGRMLLLIIISIVISSVLSSISRQSSVSGLVSLINFLINIVFSWFSLCYSLILYKEAVRGVETAPGKKLGWIVYVSVIGWIVGLFLIYFGVTTLSKVSENIHNANRDANLQYQLPSSTYSPTNQPLDDSTQPSEF